MYQALSILCLLCASFAAQAFAAGPPADPPVSRDSGSENNFPILTKFPNIHTRAKNAEQASVGQDKTAIHRPADDGRVEVRKRSQQYTSLLLRRDKAGLGGLLHKDYQAHTLAGIGLVQGDKEQAIDYWIGKRFSHLKVEAQSIRVFGDTAVEAGPLWAEFTESNGKHPSTWGHLFYTRVWVREGKTWWLVHEQF